MTDKRITVEDVIKHLQQFDPKTQRHLNEFVNEIMKFCINSNYSKRVVVDGLDYCLYCISNEINLDAWWDKNNNQIGGITND